MQILQWPRFHPHIFMQILGYRIKKKKNYIKMDHFCIQKQIIQ